MISIDIGVMADSLEEQLSQQGYTASDRHLRKMGKIRDSIFMLGFHEYISDSEKDKMFQKFIDELLSDVEKIEGEEQ